jgi:hypothetical protein
MVNRALIALAILAMANAAWADSHLLYAEAQLVAGYSFDGRPFRWYSMDQMDVMQKPSLGFDLAQRLSTETGDWGMFAVQARLAYDQTHNGNVEPQLYNAYLKVKPAFGDVWIGHNKPAFGLASYLDNHGTILQPLSFYGMSVDRDWGVGYYRDFSWGNAAVSATMGSGMPLMFRGNRLFATRIGIGDLNQNNFTIGLSASHGKVLGTMGYHGGDIIPPAENHLYGADASFNWDRFENRIEMTAQRYFFPDNGGDIRLWHMLYRLTANVLSENRLKLEAQVYGYIEKRTAVLYFYNGKQRAYGIHINYPSFGCSYALTSDLTIRGYIPLWVNMDDTQAIVQVYWYHKI